MPIKKVEAFNFKNGCYEPLNQMGYKNCVKDPTYGVIKNEDFTRRIIGMDLVQICLQRLNISFDYIFKNRRIGIGCHYNYGVLDVEDTSTYKRFENKLLGNIYYKNNYFGLDFKFYPWQHKKITHWLSFGAEIGKAGFFYILYDTTYAGTAAVHSYYSISNPRSRFLDAAYYGYSFNNGFILRPKKHLVFQGVVSFGINQLQHDFSLPYMSGKYYWGLKFGIGFSMAYAF